MEPYLFRYKEPCNSIPEAPEGCYFDHDAGLWMTVQDGEHVPAALTQVLQRLGTKKADIEKGEDQKDGPPPPPRPPRPRS